MENDTFYIDEDDDDNMIIIDNDDTFNYDDGNYDSELFIVSDFEDKEIDTLTKKMNGYLDNLINFTEKLNENINLKEQPKYINGLKNNFNLKEYFKELNRYINELKNNFDLLCETEQYVIDNSFLLKELKKIICKTIENREIELLEKKNNIVVQRYENKLKKYEMKLQNYESQKKRHPKNTQLINKLQKDIENYEKKIFL
jgi:hypothetical protein